MTPANNFQRKPVPCTRLPCCHSESFAVILIPPCGRRISLCPLRINCAKNLALDFPADKQQGEMLRPDKSGLSMTVTRYPFEVSASDSGVAFPFCNAS